MNASFKKRFFAYITDVLILNLIMTFISSFIPISDSLLNLNDQLKNVNNNYINGAIDMVTYFNQYSEIVYDIDKILFISNLISCVIIICYFIIYPLYNNGMSLGKKLFNIKVVKKDGSLVDSNGLVFRYLFMNSLSVLMLSMCGLFIFKDLYYVCFISLLQFLQFLVVIISIFMILYRRDKRSLPDLIAGTKVIEVEK